MAATNAASSGAVRGENRATTWPSRPMRNFSKFQLMSPLPAGFVFERGELFVQFASALAIDFDLGEHGERDFVVLRTEFLNVFCRSRFLAAELIAGKSKHVEPLFVVLRVQRLEFRVLGRKPTFAGDVDDEDDIAQVIAQVDVLPFERLHGATERPVGFLCCRILSHADAHHAKCCGKKNRKIMMISLRY